MIADSPAKLGPPYGMRRRERGPRTWSRESRFGLLRGSGGVGVASVRRCWGLGNERGDGMRIGLPVGEGLERSRRYGTGSLGLLCLMIVC